MSLLVVSGLVAVLAGILLYGSRRGPFRSILRSLARSVLANAVPFGYCAAMAFFLEMFDRHFLRKIAPYSAAHKMFIRISYSVPFIAIFRLYWSDPGRITPDNFSFRIKEFPYDNILYLPHTECRTCLLAKPARSKHCSVCNCCVAMQDHHCIWVNNCVGRDNVRYFYLFLAANMYVFMYGFFLLVNPLSRQSWKVWQRLHDGQSERAAFCLLLLCVLILPLVVGFIAFHLRYIYSGVTTNENDKWEDIVELIGDRVLYFYPHTNILLLKKGEHFNRSLTPNERDLVRNDTLREVTNVADLPNIYDKGFLKNLKVALNFE